jgi:hypothetical protein
MTPVPERRQRFTDHDMVVAERLAAIETASAIQAERFETLEGTVTKEILPLLRKIDQNCQTRCAEDARRERAVADALPAPAVAAATASAANAQARTMFWSTVVSAISAVFIALITGVPAVLAIFFGSGKP